MVAKLDQPKVPHKVAYTTLAVLYAGNCVGMNEYVFYLLVALIYLGLSLD